MQLKTVKIDKPDGMNFILGQTHFIKSVEEGTPWPTHQPALDDQ